MGVAGAIVDWLRDYAARAGAKGYVFGLSGGVDSACVAALCLRAVGKRNVVALWLPCYSSSQDAEMASLVAGSFGLKLVTVDLAPAYDALVAALPKTTKMARANIKPRLRMAAWYAVAHTRGYLVAGGGNKTEILAGYFTKYGDAGVDLLPLGDLYKWQVRELAHELGVHQAVIERAPSAGLWSGQTDEAEIGLTYPELDAALAAIGGRSQDGVDPDVLAKVSRMMECSAHKRALPPVCRLTSRARGEEE